MGGDNPIRVQSMTTSDTQDVAATVRQAIALAEVGCEIVRVTAPNVAAARCLREIRAEFSRAGFSRVPLVADIHFLPQAAMEAVEHVEKIRINPGNYADKNVSPSASTAMPITSSSSSASTSRSPRWSGAPRNSGAACASVPTTARSRIGS